ncbi:uncharacterized protein MELLADRAFT_92826 [Melampsora larici-populina 98AG31]|uniref:Uncharacterized protein n=1 Tax=Melampsora larici-populina (strain 98AG31 / pathotype 3-4-7) TaxID=747676 RepID=F4S2X7_MELLP|nr:uncharacterized protein MELLADRAFT_92826 [Melampsora larici-populina 98AG31]EGG00879.1 hypothetical protein MELLADRAFT_92826 [Melampsora larici-populina 98AG31]
MSSTLPTPRPTTATPAIQDPPPHDDDPVKTQADAVLTTTSPCSPGSIPTLPLVASTASPLPSLNQLDPLTETTTSPKASPAVLINPPGGVPTGGLPVPVNPDVRQVSLTPSIWAVESPTNFQVTKKTVEKKTIDNSDVPDMYRAALDLLCKRTRGTDQAALEVQSQPTPPFKILPKSKLRVHTWLSKDPNMRLFQCAAEAPWHRADIFRLDNAALIKKGPSKEEAHTQYVREILGVFCHSSATKINQSVKYVLAAVAYCKMETVEIQPPQVNLEICPDVQIANGLKAAHHYHQLQLCTGNSTVQECVIAMWELVHKIYGLLEAIASLRARFRHVEQLFHAPEQQHKQLDAAYDKLTKSAGAGQIPTVPFGLLVAFLTSGVKGLLLFPHDPKRFGLCKLAHFLVLVSRIHGDRPIEEPFWKHTQALLLKLIREALFPEGFDSASGLTNDGVNEASIQDQWHPKECSKLLLAQAIQRDLAAFCQMRPVLTGAPYPDNPYDLPFHPVSTGNQTTVPQADMYLKPKPCSYCLLASCPLYANHTCHLKILMYSKCPCLSPPLSTSEIYKMNLQVLLHVTCNTKFFAPLWALIPCQLLHLFRQHQPLTTTPSHHCHTMPLTLGSHATALGPLHVLCSCPQLGCSQKMIEYMGNVHRGQLFSRTRYPKHLADINRLVDTMTPLPSPSDHPAPQSQQSMLLQPLIGGPSNTPVASTSRAVLPPVLPPIGAATPMRSNKQARDTEDDEVVSAPHHPKAPRLDLGHTQTTTSIPRRFLQDPLCMREMFEVAKEHLFHNVGVKACNKSLAKARESVKEQKLTQDPTTRNKVWKEIPLGLPTLLKTLKLEPSVQSKTCCPFCCALSSIQEPLPLNASPVPLCDVPRFTTKANCSETHAPLLLSVATFLAWKDASVSLLWKRH